MVHGSAVQRFTVEKRMEGSGFKGEDKRGQGSGFRALNKGSTIQRLKKNNRFTVREK
jgi:hypothetical protein